MKRIRELEVWSLPGRFFDPDYSKNSLQKELRDEGIPSDVFLGISSIPERLDLENLKITIESGETTQQSFVEFCLAHGLSTNPESEDSSSKFLEYLHGRCLAWIHLPMDADAALLSKIVKTLAIRGHIVIDPVTKEKVTLAN